jgi:hypothetical protein
VSASSKDPVDCLREIAALAMDRMNTSQGVIAPAEAFTLGQITGIAMRVSGVTEYLKAREEQSDGG